MKKIVFIVCLMIFSLSASSVFASNPDLKNKSDKLTNPNKTENKLTQDELNRITKRVEEIRDLNKSNLSVKEKMELRKELRVIKKTVRRDGGGYIYIGGSTLLLIIIILILI